ncbi:MAG TPA: amidohydrolase family protein, partial [Gemmatimonadaceae bacterium]|nr:amidohydrolase family protein [Gemmatimonadaceae bacterium]
MRLSTPLLSGILCAALLPLVPDPAGAQDGTWALTNARIETVTKGTIERGTIIIRNGLIAAVGADVAPPPDARVVDLGGRTIYPGIINLTSSIGVPAAPAATGGGRGPGGGGGGPAAATDEQPLELSPGRAIARELAPSDADLRAARDAGITTALVAPTRGAFRGLSALLPMRADSATSYIVKAPVGVHMGFEGVRGRYPGNLLGVMAYERQAMYDARRHGLMMDAWQANPTSMARPVRSPDLDALVPVVRGDRPVFFEASNENEIRRAMSIANEFDLDLHIVGATEAFLTIDELKGKSAPVVVVDFPDADDVTGWSYRGAQRVALNDSATRAPKVETLLEANAATLHRNGITFALASGSVRPADFLANVRKTVAAGLPANVAIAALTIRPAEIAGVEKTLGSIETGKIADLVVTTGPLLG